jgi:carboxylesterase type B
MAPLATLLTIISAVSVSANTLLATLDYGSFQGYYDDTYNMSYWRKIPFAAPPVGENRFRAPQAPLQVNGTYDTNADFSECPQRTANGSEDCLYLGVYARPWSEGQKLRPVFVEIYGGAFVEGSASTDVPGPFYPLVNSSDESDFIAVGTNYRLNAFGFLPGQEIHDDPLSDFNVGLLDQQYALEWIHKYIHLFGGDASQVTIIGQSAGGGSTVAQSIANGGKTDPPLFQRALSLSPFWPKTYRYNAPQAQAIYDQFVSNANCSGASNTLECLKAADLDILITAAYGITYSDEYGPNSYIWAPVIDGTFLPNTLTYAVENGAINAPAHWGMYNTYEGENFIPSGLNTSDSSPYNSSDAAFELWLGDFLPGLSQSDLGRLLTVYPPSGSSEAIESYNTTYIRAELIYRDLVLSCPGHWLAQAAEVGYQGQYSILPALHGSDVEWVSDYTQEQAPFSYTDIYIPNK